MFSTRRSRPRRSSRFVPMVDTLQARYAPVGHVAPLDPPPDDPPPVVTVVADAELIEALETFDEVCGTSPTEI